MKASIIMPVYNREAFVREAAADVKQKIAQNAPAYYAYFAEAIDRKKEKVEKVIHQQIREESI